MSEFSSLPNEILVVIFAKSGIVEEITVLSKKYNKFFEENKNNILKQIFANNNIKVDINDAYHVYIEMKTLNYNFETLYKFLNDKGDGYMEVIQANCFNIMKLYMLNHDTFEVNSELLYKTIENDNIDMFELFVSCDTMKSEYFSINLIKYIHDNSLGILKLLIHKYKLDSTYNNYELLRDAAQTEIQYMVNILLSDLAVDNVLARIVINEGENDFSYITNVHRRRIAPSISTEYVNFGQNEKITIEPMEERLAQLAEMYYQRGDIIETRIVAKIMRKFRRGRLRF